jgi:hypothetical protein
VSRPEVWFSHADYQTENERLPTELGWKIPSTVISLDDLLGFSQDIYNATSYAALETEANMMRRNGMVGKVF